MITLIIKSRKENLLYYHFQNTKILHSRWHRNHLKLLLHLQIQNQAFRWYFLKTNLNSNTYENLLTIEINDHGYVGGTVSTQYQDGIGCWGCGCIWLRGGRDIWSGRGFSARIIRTWTTTDTIFLKRYDSYHMNLSPLFEMIRYHWYLPRKDSQVVVQENRHCNQTYNSGRHYKHKHSDPLPNCSHPGKCSNQHWFPFPK